MKNYKKFMSEIDERIAKKKNIKIESGKGLLGRGAPPKKSEVPDDFKQRIADYIAAIRETKEKLKASKNAK